MTEEYGRSPMMNALPLLREWDALSPEERANAAAQFVKDNPMYVPTWPMPIEPKTKIRF